MFLRHGGRTSPPEKILGRSLRRGKHFQRRPMPTRYSSAMTRIALTEAQQQALWQAARAAQTMAYAPYSGFKVGAAVLDAQGRIHTGCNVENAAYPEGLCAEAAALSAMVLAGSTRALAVLVVGPGDPEREELQAPLKSWWPVVMDKLPRRRFSRFPAVVPVRAAKAWHAARMVGRFPCAGNRSVAAPGKAAALMPRGIGWSFASSGVNPAGPVFDTGYCG